MRSSSPSPFAVDRVAIRLPFAILRDADEHIDTIITGAYGATLRARRWGSTIYVRGCLARYVQGHQVFCSLPLHALIEITHARVAATLGLPLLSDDVWAVQGGRVDIREIEVYHQFRALSATDARRAARVIEAAGRVGRQRTARTMNTAYAGRSSARSTTRVYAKHDEVLYRGLPADLPHRDDILEWSRDVVRIEVGLKRQALRDAGLDTLAGWRDPARAAAIMDRRIAQIRALDNAAPNLPADIVANLSTSVRATYAEWSTGADVRATMKTATFYRHLASLRAQGIDIARPRSTGRGAGALAAMIEAGPAKLPRWV